MRKTGIPAPGVQRVKIIDRLKIFQVRISFKWQDAFDKESLFSGKRTLSIAAGSFEKVCLLFNIAALQSQIADVQNLSSDDGLKLAAKLFQVGLSQVFLN